MLGPQVFRGIKNGVQPVAVKVLAQSDDMQLAQFAKVSRADDYWNAAFQYFFAHFRAQICSLAVGARLKTEETGLHCLLCHFAQNVLHQTQAYV